MSETQHRNKKATSMRLTPEALRLLELLAQKGGISQAAVVETLIREKAKREKISGGPDD
jgi:predicted DNA-binding protein